MRNSVKPSMLLVDDDAAARDVLGTVFERREFDVLTAASAAEAQAVLSIFAFDLVVTGLHMENDRSGYDVVRCANACSERPLSVILSSSPIPDGEWQAAGADAAFVTSSGLRKTVESIERRLATRNEARIA